MTLFGFSLNNLSIFGLVLSIGSWWTRHVVVENLGKHHRLGLSPAEAEKVP